MTANLTNSGFFIVPRALVGSQVWPRLEATHRVVYITILERANWKRGEWLDGLKLVPIEPGQLVTSQEHLAAQCGRGFTRQIVRTALRTLKNAQLIDLEATSMYTRITVVEYERYTTDYYFGNQRHNPVDNQSITNGQPSDNRRITTIESIKAVKALKQEDTNIHMCALEFQEFWNSHNSLPRIAKMTEGRIRALTQAMEDQDFCASWEEAIEELSGSEFHTGGGEGGWVADVDWFLKEDNWVKCLELASHPAPEDLGEEQAEGVKEETRRFLREFEEQKRRVQQEREPVRTAEDED